MIFKIYISEDQQHLYSFELTGKCELGRQDDGEPCPFNEIAGNGCVRVIIAHSDENNISRRHLHLEPLPDGRLLLANLSTSQHVFLGDGQKLVPGDRRTIQMPVRLGVGRKVLEIEELGEGPGLATLVTATRAPSVGPESPSLSTPSAIRRQAEIIPWLQNLMGVFLSAATSSDFFDRAARAVVEVVGLDYGRVLTRESGTWGIRAFFRAARAADRAGRGVSNRVLEAVCTKKRTFWETPKSGSGSLKGIDCVVAAPILDRNGDVVAVLYGDRLRNDDVAATVPLTDLDGLLVEFLASGVAAGLARQREAEAALAAQVRFEQFFTPELARQLTVQPDLLQGQDRDVSILFCDIRRFSAISEALAPARTGAWLADVLEVLSGCVLAERGVLVDYIGDELMAMWGAPEADPTHPQRACRAALAMLDHLPRLNARWQATIGTPIELAIGVNTGVARVGNTGSQRKFKYGPLGNEVNLASRVQGATKYFKCPLLITASTQSRLGDQLPTRRIGTARVVNITTPVVLYELTSPQRAGWEEARQEYEKALLAFEEKQYRSAARIMGTWCLQHPDDGPGLVLLGRAVNCMLEEPSEFESVLVLPGKGRS
jgi:adenylate cyclase